MFSIFLLLQIKFNAFILRERASCENSPSLFFLHSHAGGDTKGGGNSGQYSNDNVQDFAPKFFFHDD